MKSVTGYCRAAGAKFEPAAADADAVYERTIEIDISHLEPLIARPGHPEDVVPVSEVASTGRSIRFSSDRAPTAAMRT